MQKSPNVYHANYDYSGVKTTMRKNGVEEEGECRCGSKTCLFVVAVGRTVAVALVGGTVGPVGLGVGSAGTVVLGGVVVVVAEDNEVAEIDDYHEDVVVVVVMEVLVVEELVFAELVDDEQAAHLHRHTNLVHNTQGAHPPGGASRVTTRRAEP